MTTPFGTNNLHSYNDVIIYRGEKAPALEEAEEADEEEVDDEVENPMSQDRGSVVERESVSGGPIVADMVDVPVLTFSKAVCTHVICHMQLLVTSMVCGVE